MAFDLDEEELEATRKLKGLGKIEDKMNLKEAKRHLRRYIDEDSMYQDYKRDKSLIKSDWDKFCVEHCEAIDVALQELEKHKMGEKKC